jgi:hypothetical protein
MQKPIEGAVYAVGYWFRFCSAEYMPCKDCVEKRKLDVSFHFGAVKVAVLPDERWAFAVVAVF